jgi:hypothetical protein
MPTRTPAQIEAKARAMVASRTTYDLITDFEYTETLLMSTDLAMARGWIMDELEARDPDAFDAWMDANENSPRRFYTDALEP